MEYQEFFSLVHSVSNSITEDQMHLPIEHTALDSLDYLNLRSILEVRLGRAITDNEWLDVDTLFNFYETSCHED